MLGMGLMSACDEAAPVRGNEPAKQLPMGMVSQGALLPMSDEELFSALDSAPYQDLKLNRVRGDSVDMLVFTALLNSFRPAMMGLDVHQGKGVTALTALTEGGMQLVIGSGFVSELHALAPVGLLQIDGVVVNEIQRYGYTRVLGVRDTGFGVVGHRQFEQGLFDSALQAGPGVIEEGHLDISERDLQRIPYFRAVVGTCDDKVLFGITMIPMHLHTLGKVILDFARAESLQCDELVNLAGDREAVLALRRNDGAIFHVGNPLTSKAALVGLRRR